MDSRMASLEASPGEGPRRTGRDEAISLSRPLSTDGADIHDLVAACPPLDTNSLYASLLLCTHHAATCALARTSAGGKAVGWVSGYILPDAPDTYFLWQVAVHEDARGLGLPKRLVADILSRPELARVSRLKTTITPDNQASWGLFRSVARWLGAELNDASFFDRQAHFRGRHDSERMVEIGPFALPPPTL